MPDHKPDSPKAYRSALMIIQLMLEEIIKTGDEGIVKTQLFSDLGLKTKVGEKYLEQIIKAEYATMQEEAWGKERSRQVIKITAKGENRFQWFIRLSNELNL
jgi:predicted transcriptional regulator